MDLRKAMVFGLALLLFVAAVVRSQQSVWRDYPKEIRGYKVERAKVEVKRQHPADEARPDETNRGDQSTGDADALIRFGEPRVVRVTPLGLTLEVPVTVAAVNQGGHVDFLTFEDVVVNGKSVSIDDYTHPFELPTKGPLTLPEPIRLFISTPSVLLGALDEWNNSKQVWPVTGRVYVFGRFKKFLFNFKRAVPIELSLSLQNPLRVEKRPVEPASNQ